MGGVRGALRGSMNRSLSLSLLTRSDTMKASNTIHVTSTFMLKRQQGSWWVGVVAATIFVN